MRADDEALEASRDRPTLRLSAPWSRVWPRAPHTVAGWDTSDFRLDRIRRHNLADDLSRVFPRSTIVHTREERCRHWTNVCGRSRSSRTSRTGSTSMKSWRKRWSWERRPMAWKPSWITVRTDPSRRARIDDFDVRSARTRVAWMTRRTRPGVGFRLVEETDGETDANISFGDSRLGQCSARDIEGNHQTNVERIRRSGFRCAQAAS